MQCNKHLHLQYLSSAVELALCRQHPCDAVQALRCPHRGLHRRLTMLHRGRLPGFLVCLQHRCSTEVAVPTGATGVL